MFCGICMGHIVKIRKRVLKPPCYEAAIKAPQLLCFHQDMGWNNSCLFRADIVQGIISMVEPSIRAGDSQYDTPETSGLFLFISSCSLQKVTALVQKKYVPPSLRRKLEHGEENESNNTVEQKMKDLDVSVSTANSQSKI
jgi:hypothetical protein